MRLEAMNEMNETFNERYIRGLIISIRIQVLFTACRT